MAAVDYSRISKEFVMPRDLVDHTEIRQWAEARAGIPILRDVPDGTGSSHRVLQLSFGQDLVNAQGNDGPDRPGGYDLVSWDEWLSALEEKGLALRVSDDPSGGAEAEYEIVDREGGD